MTPQELWKNICQEAKNYFDFSLEWCVSDLAGAWQAGGLLTTQGGEQERRKEGAMEELVLGSRDGAVSPGWWASVAKRVPQLL